MQNNADTPVEQAQIDREALTPIAANIATTEAYLPRHQDSLHELGLSKLSFDGNDRLVFDTGEDTVIKIVRTESGTDINYDEAANWSLYGDSNLFAPVVNTGPHHAWLEMGKCRPTEDEDLLSHFQDKMEQRGIKIYDTHVENIGWFNGELVAYDYPEIRVEQAMR